MALKFTTTHDAAKLHGIKMLVYGNAGVGKTTLSATAPSPIILSAEAGLLSLRDKNIPVIQIETVDDLRDAHTWLTTSEDAQQFETICLDSISEIAEVVLANAKAQTKDPRQAYGELIEKMMVTLRAFRDISGKHVYFSAKAEAIKDEVTGVVRHGPSMPGSKLGPQLPYLFDEVFHLTIGQTPEGEKYRYLQTQADMQYDAKDRSGALDAVEYPDLSNVFHKILGDNNGAA